MPARPPLRLYGSNHHVSDLPSPFGLGINARLRMPRSASHQDQCIAPPPHSKAHERDRLNRENPLTILPLLNGPNLGGIIRANAQTILYADWSTVSSEC